MESLAAGVPVGRTPVQRLCHPGAQALPPRGALASGPRGADTVSRAPPAPADVLSAGLRAKAPTPRPRRGSGVQRGPGCGVRAL
jgi:hypothetical protein